jgi:iron complex transport system ATP-binding protein
MAELMIDDVSVQAGSVKLVKHASFTLRPGQLAVIIGENGAGKSSLLRAIAAYEIPSTGRVLVDDAPIVAMAAKDRARHIAWLPQSIPMAWPIRVRDAVALGRYAYGAGPTRLSAEDRRAVEAALVDCDLVSLADRSTATLSGGELARVHVARALASGASILLADEPVAALDPRHRLAVMDRIAAHVARGGSALVVLHDLALAARYATRVIAMLQGRILVEGAPGDVITAEWIERLFGVRAEVTLHNGYTVPHIAGIA